MAQRRKKRNNRLPAALRWLLIGMMALGVMMLCGALALLLKRRRPARR